MTASPETAHVLLVEDDVEIRDLVQAFLSRHGYAVSLAAEGRAAEMRLAQEPPVDLLMLDIMLPGEDGLSLCRRLRAQSSVPILMLTALGEDTDRIVGLEMGADDYLPKPFNPRELLARVRALLRRAAMTPARRTVAPVLSFDGWRLDLGLRQLHSPAGVRVEITSGEFDLLLAFCHHPRQLLSRERLLDLTRGPGSAPFERSIDIQVSRLRRKIEADGHRPALIKTVRALGYYFTALVDRTEGGTKP
jgi:two-component system OmpR family response regulator